MTFQIRVPVQVTDRVLPESTSVTVLNLPDVYVKLVTYPARVVVDLSFPSLP